MRELNAVDSVPVRRKHGFRRNQEFGARWLASPRTNYKPASTTTGSLKRGVIMFTSTIVLLAIKAMVMNNVEGYVCETSLKSGTDNWGEAEAEIINH